MGKAARAEACPAASEHVTVTWSAEAASALQRRSSDGISAQAREVPMPLSRTISNLCVALLPAV